MRIGIVGLPNVGKTTLFNALTRLKARTANYPFTTVEPNVGVVPIPDDRLSAIAQVVGSKKTTPATIEVVDIAGLVKGAHTGAGLGNEFLSHIRAVDALLHVVRAFDDPEIARAGSATPAADITTIQEELRAKDAEIQGRREKRNEEQGMRSGEIALAAKPVLYVFNAGERSAGTPAAAAQFQPSVVLSAKIEADLAELPEDEQRVFRQEYSLDHSRTLDVLRSAINLLQLMTFFTANENEARAWLTQRGTTALAAAGKVHTDFARNFIRAETIEWRTLLNAGSYGVARQRGLVRDEGKEYQVQDGDVLLFKTST